MSALMLQTPDQAWHYFAAHPLSLLLMPVVGAFIGWITKVLAIEMVFRPVDFKGIGPLGWQGQLPRRAAKFGSHAADILLDNVIDPRMLVDRLDPVRIANELDGVMLDAVDDVARDLIGSRWDQLPAAARNAVIARARTRSPQMVANLLKQGRDNIDELFDLTYIVTETLVRDKPLLVDLVRGPMEPIMTFMKRFGLVFGFIVGLVQMVVFAFTLNHWVIPIFGFSVGLVSDWIALQMIFLPHQPKRYLGLFKWYGLAFRHRDHFVDEYAALAAERVFTPAVIMGALLDGPLADRMFAMARQEVEWAIDAELGFIEPMVPAVIGSNRYLALRETVVSRAQQRLHQAAEQLGPYTAEALAIEQTTKDSLGSLDNKHLESMLRPVFKDDEWLVVVIGGGLGFVVGELQVQLLFLLGVLHH